MRQKIRRILLYTSLFLFPITMNFLSPYVSIDGAFAGVLSGSAVMFIILFLSGLFFGRAWCGWVCPAGGVAEIAQTVNPKPANAKGLRIVRYCHLRGLVWRAGHGLRARGRDQGHRPAAPDRAVRLRGRAGQVHHLLLRAGAVFHSRSRHSAAEAPATASAG